MELSAGTATISLTFVNGSSPHHGNRNVDLIMLHPNRSDIDLRLVVIPDELYYTNAQAGARVDLRDYEAVKAAYNPTDLFAFPQSIRMTPQQMVYSHVQQSAHLTFREPAGVLKFKYLVPAGPYNQMWDWDSLFMGVAMLDQKTIHELK